VPLPKRKKSISKKNMRRSHDQLTVPQLSVCPKCNEPRLPHHVCPSCGFYKGRLVLPQAEK
ncbi:MAG: 50S ribosomal protein L32, partial [Desulfobaccales bacterium]|nr:50S ribosomal protein L32 [Desulfobaccales bacterium]